MTYVKLIARVLNREGVFCDFMERDPFIAFLWRFRFKHTLSLAEVSSWFPNDTRRARYRLHCFRTWIKAGKFRTQSFETPEGFHDVMLMERLQDRMISVAAGKQHGPPP